MHSIGYRFSIVKFKIANITVGTIIESSGVIFFKNIFLMKDISNLPNLKMHSFIKSKINYNS
jgi:hypothetical protein